MKIDGAGSVAAAQRAALQAQKKMQPIEEPKASVQQATPSAEAAQPQERGVIRRLMEGHFRGVADVRLRINFAEEIAAVEAAGRQTAGAAGLEELRQSVEPALQELTNSGLLSEEQLAAVEAFGQSIQSAGEAVDASGVIEGLRAEFESLMGLLTPADAEPAADPLAALASSLRETFETALKSLRQRMDAVSVLPELSPPTGNGKAYEKFLAIYRSMNDSAPAEGAATDETAAEASGEPLVF